MASPRALPIEERPRNLFESEYKLLLKSNTQVKKLTVQKQKAWAYRLSLITFDIFKTWEEDGKP